ALKEDDRVRLRGFPPSLEETQISIIRPDKEGNVWIATAGDEVYRYDTDDKNFRYDLDLNASLRPLRITAMTTDQRNNLWIGTDGALIMWDPQLKKSTKYTRSDGLTGNNITALFCDSRGSLWIGTEEQKGLARLNPGNGTFITLTFRSDVHPTAITETPDGMIWVGTIDGLYGLSNDTVKKKLTEAEGLLMNSINLLQPDRSGNLFIGTNLGLNRYDSNTGRISSFTEKSGFTGIETRPNASFADDMGDLWFGTSNGAMRLSPSMLPPVVTEPATHIWRTLVNYEVYPMHDGIRLLHTQNRIIFDFLSICLVNPGAVRYQFMLEGADKEWITTDQNRAV
ncbi:MAG TPA: two-component regulator propeller domain-containing protein, partial [Bacteroidales bacterium]|nr:two-component regulator propeller domain-containing protein [Bacteroidales bacterium]